MTLTGTTPAGAKAAAGVDPAIAGAWELSFTDAMGKTHRYVMEFRNDGTYTYHDQAKGHSGTYQALNGTWSGQSYPGQRLWKDGGTYSFPDKDTLHLKGATVTTAWKRVKDKIYFVTEQIGSERIPKYVPRLVAAALIKEARPWRNDAVPVGVRFLRTKYHSPYLRVHFASPSDGALMHIDVHQFERTTFHYKTGGAGHTYKKTFGATPPVFVDLPEAVKIAQRHGVRGSLNDAWLREFERGHRAWSLGFQSGGRGETVNIEATTGVVIKGELTNVIADYNKQWDEALANLRKLFERLFPKSAGSSGPDMCLGDCYAATKWHCKEMGGTPDNGYCR
jgi:hypothetical protein